MQNNRQQRGAVALAITMMLMIPIMLLTVVSFNHAILERKSANNTLAAEQAFYAAQAGLSFGMQYLTSNTSTVTGSPSGGYINYGPSDGNVTHVALPDGATFSTVYTNPTQNNYSLLKITSTGTSPDGTSTHVVSQLVANTGLSSTLVSAVTTGLNSSAMLDLGFNSAGGSATLDITGGTFRHRFDNTASNWDSYGGLVTIPLDDYDPNLQPVSTGTLQSGLGMSYSQFQAIATTLTLTGTPPHLTSATLNQLQAGGAFLINSDYLLSGGGNIGNASSPVFLVVNGNFTMSSSENIYGIIVALGQVTVEAGSSTQNASANERITVIINGALVCQSIMVYAYNQPSPGSAQAELFVSYNAAAIANAAPSASSFVPVPGSWSDF